MTIEPYDWSAETEEFGLETGVVSHENRGTIKNLSISWDIPAPAVSYFWKSPKIRHRMVARMVVPDDVPAPLLPGSADLGKALKEFGEDRSRLRDAGPLSVPVKRDGDSFQFRLSTSFGMPVIEFWASNDGSWNRWVLKSPGLSNRFVGAHKADGVVMSTTATVATGSAKIHAPVSLASTVLDIHVTDTAEFLRIIETSDDRNDLIGLFTQFKQGIEDGLYVIPVVGKTSD